MKRLVIEEEKIIHNLEVIGERSGGALLIAVLKANAYGLGMLPMADLLRRQGVKRFGVTEPEDAVALRDGGFLDEEILMLRSTAVKEDIEKILSSTATAAIGSYDAAVAVNGMAEEAGMVVDVHVEIPAHGVNAALSGTLKAGVNSLSAPVSVISDSDIDSIVQLRERLEQFADLINTALKRVQ